MEFTSDRPYFDTKFECDLYLEQERLIKYENIKKDNDTVLSDTSQSICKLMWSKPEQVGDTGLYSSTQTSINKWQVMWMIWTQNMLDDIKTFPIIDYEEEFTKLINNTKSI